MKLIALVGKPNVGKSTLFNRLVGRRQAIVGAQPGVTRDRNVAPVERKGYRYLLMDTGGFEPEAEAGIPAKMKEQSRLAVEEADLILFVMDRTSGLTEQDRDIYRFLAQASKPVYVVVNKVDGDKHELDLAEFYELGAEEVFGISAEHGRGLGDLLERLSERHPEIIEPEDNRPEEYLSIALLGRPNAGKSSLSNAFLGENKQIVHDEPGTTRDPVDNHFRYQNRAIRLIDTAGLKRKARVGLKVDQYSMAGSIRSIERADLCLLVIDATEGVVDQDARIGGYIVERGRAVVIVVNKWDLLEKDSKTLHLFERDLHEKLDFLSFAPIVFVSALTKQRVPKILDEALKVDEQYRRRVQTADFNRVLEQVTLRHQPPGKAGKKTRLYYGAQVSTRPPSFVVHVNEPKNLGESYRRFLVNQLRHYFGFDGTPIQVFWRAKSKNPK